MIDRTTRTLPLAFAMLGTAVLMGVIVGWAVRGPARVDAGPTVKFESHGITIEEVRKLAKLVTLEVPISDVQTTDVGGWTGGISVVLVVRGDVDIATDLDKATFESVDAEKRRAVLHLPQPTTSRPRLDQTKTKVYRVERSGLWSLMPGEAGEPQVISAAMKRAQEMIDEAAKKPELIEQARCQAALVLENFFHAMNWQVELRWGDGASPSPTPKAQG